MADQTQEPINPPLPRVNRTIPYDPVVVDDEEDALAREELKRISLSNEELRKLAAKFPPPSEYFEGEEAMPFDPVEE